MATIPSNLQYPKQNQIPDNAIMDINGRQTYIGNSFSFSPASQSLGTTTETPLVLFVNPLSGNKSLFFQWISASSSAQAVLLKIYSNPTITTNGTVGSAANLRPATTKTSVSSIYTLPTISANGTLLKHLAIPSAYASAANDGEMVIIDPGFNLLITGTAVTATTLVNSNYFWYEL